MTTRKLLIIGDGAIAREAASIARRTRDPATVSVEPLTPDRIATSTLDFLRGADPATTEVFAAIGVSALNYARFDLWARLRMLGYRCATLVNPSASVDAAATLADNVLVAAHAVIGPDAVIRSGTMIQANACVLGGARVDQFVWVGVGASIGSDAQVGAHEILGSGVLIADSSTIGGHGEISVPGFYRGEIARGTFIAAEFRNPVRLVGP